MRFQFVPFSAEKAVAVMSKLEKVIVLKVTLEMWRRNHELAVAWGRTDQSQARFLIEDALNDAAFPVRKNIAEQTKQMLLNAVNDEQERKRA